MGSAVMLVGWVLPFSYLAKLLIQLALGALLTFALSELFKPDAYLELKKIAFRNLGNKK